MINYGTDKYVSLLNLSLVTALCRFKCVNHIMPIEYVRFHTVERANRICILCNSGEIVDELHYLSKFIFISIKNLIPTGTEICNLMKSNDKHTLVKLAIFCKKVVSHFDVINK
jgi:hypothetical protein